MEEFHTIIAGAGPAGLQCARKLSSLGYKVAVFESNSIPGEPNYSTAGIPIDAFKYFGLPESCIGHSFSKTSFRTSKLNLSWDFGKTAGYTMDFRKMKLFLIGEIEKNGSAISHGSRVTNAIKGSSGVEHIEYFKAGQMHNAAAKYYVDGTGFSGAITTKIGLRKLRPCSPAVGVEKVIRIRLDDQFKDNIVFYFGDDYIPYGYAWVFHFGEDLYKIGVCTLNEHKLTKKGYHIKDCLDRFTAKIGKGEEIEEHGGSIFVNGGYAKNTWKNVMMIGDTAGTINPELGEGIRHALYSGDMAADAIHEIDTGRASSLSVYDKKLKAYRKNRWLVSKILSDIIYYSPDNIKNFLIGRLKKLSPEEMYECGFGLNHSLLIRRMFF